MWYTGSEGEVNRNFAEYQQILGRQDAAITNHLNQIKAEGNISGTGMNFHCFQKQRIVQFVQLLLSSDVETSSGK